MQPFTSAGIILSYQCSSRCRHCLYNCGRELSGWADPALVEAIYRGTRACLGTPRGFHLAGGEAFLNFPLLLQAVRLATQHGIPLDYVETNAHWFTGREDAEAKLTALREAGLSCLLISASPLHAEYIPFEKTRGLVATSLAVFGSGGTFVWLPEFFRELSDMGLTGTLPFADYARRVGPTRAREAARYGGHLTPGGRAPYALADYLPQHPLAACLTDSCARELLHSGHGHYDLHGNIIPACCTGLSLGHAADLEAWARDFSLADKPVLRTLVESGTHGLLAWAQAETGYVSHPHYAGPCHLCLDIRRHLVAQNAPHPELAPRTFYQSI